MQFKILEEAKVICPNRRSFQNYFGWSTVGRLPGGELALVSSGNEDKAPLPLWQGGNMLQP